MNRIFTITPGRSGSHWLSALFWMTTNLPHTAKPDYFPQVDPGDEGKRRAAVQEVWDNLPEEYVGTSLIPKNWCLQALAEKGARFIHLTRPIMENAYSWYRNRGIPGRTPRGLGYHPSPYSEDNIVKLKDPASLTDFQLCLWLCFEVRMRARKIAEVADVKSVNLLSVSSDVEEARDLLEWTGFDYGLDWFSLILKRRINKTTDENMTTPMTFAQRIEEHERLVDLLGVELE